MPSRSTVFTLVTLLLLSAAASAQTERNGQTPGGSFYSISVPTGWTPADGLVIWNHGFDLDPPSPNPGLGPLVDVQLAEGYAVAASSYRLSGWALFDTAADNRELVQAFEGSFGTPEQIIVYGASMGGLVTAQAIESGALGNVVGAMPICGATAGSRLWDGGLDLRLLYDAICSAVPGAEIPGGAGGLPFPPDPSLDQLSLLRAVTECTGVPLPASARTPAQQQRLDDLLRISSIPNEEFLLIDLGFATFGLQDLVFDPDKLSGGAGLTNVLVDYGDPVINANIERVAADPGDRKRLLDNYTPTGQVGDVKIVSIHTDKDGLVIVENASEYAAVVPPGNLTTGIVVESMPTHCDFTEAEVLAAWESLRGWVAGLPQPTVADLQSTCQTLDAADLAEGPCRFDPDFVVPALDQRIRARGGNCVQDDNALCLGEDGRFQLEITWRDFEGKTGSGRTTPFSTLDTGSFWFFNPENVEMTVKVLDGRGINGRFWVFYGSLTNVEFELTVTDTQTGVVRTYQNPLGTFASVGDTEAF